MGGRNQEFALVSAMELMGYPGLYLLSAGSDGSDGPTAAAGAFADGSTISKARTLGLDPYQALRDNDSYNFFSRLGDLFCPGPTGTNVLDFKIILLY
jgi:glycerate-2-kinase